MKMCVAPAIKKFIIAVLLGFAGMGISAEVFVAMNGNDLTGDGTSAKPYAIVHKAVEVLGESGGTIMVRKGTYIFSTTDSAEDGRSCVVITTPVKIVGETGNPSDVENCLITKGFDTSKHTAAVDEGTVVLKGYAKLINCTVVGNAAQRFSGAHIES